MDFGKAGGILQFSVDFVFVAELWASSAVLFELDGYLWACERGSGVLENVSIAISEEISPG